MACTSDTLAWIEFIDAKAAREKTRFYPESNYFLYNSLSSIVISFCSVQRIRPVSCAALLHSSSKE